MTDDELMFWGAIRTGLVSYSEASEMYMWELEEVVNAGLYFKNLELDVINEALEDTK